MPGGGFMKYSGLSVYWQIFRYTRREDGSGAGVMQAMPAPDALPADGHAGGIVATACTMAGRACRMEAAGVMATPCT